MRRPYLTPAVSPRRHPAEGSAVLLEIGVPSRDTRASSWTRARWHAERLASPHSLVIFFPLHGAIDRLPPDHSPFGNRDARSVFNIGASWERPEDDAPNIAWARAAWEDLRRFSTGGTYVNFLTEEEGSERIHAAYGPNYERLAAVKAQWDPTNLFHHNKNIPPTR